MILVQGCIFQSAQHILGWFPDPGPLSLPMMFKSHIIGLNDGLKQEPEYTEILVEDLSGLMMSKEMIHLPKD